MRLNVNVGAAIVVGLFLMTMIGMRDSLRDDFVAEFNQPRPLPTLPVAMAPPVEADTLAFPGAIGMGRGALTACRDSVINGSWDLKVWIVDPATYSGQSSAPMGLTDIVYDSTSDDAYDIIILPQGGHLYISDTDRTQRTNLQFFKDCVFMSGAPGQGDGPPVIMVDPDPESTVRLNIGVNGDGTDDFASDVVLRDIRIWGDSAKQTGSTPAISIRKGQRIIVDHSELMMGPSNMEVYPNAGLAGQQYLRDLSLTHNTIGPFHNWGTGETLLQVKIGDDYYSKPTPEDSATNFTIARNYLVHNSHRMPGMGASFYPAIEPTREWDQDRWELVNNLVHDFGNVSRMVVVSGGIHMDAIGNVYSEATDRTIGVNFQPFSVRRCDALTHAPAKEGAQDSVEMFQATIYQRDNIYLEGGVVQPQSNRDLFYTADVSPTYYNCGRGSTLAPDSSFTDTRNATADSVTTVWSATAVDDSLFDGSVLAQVGPRQLSCSGVFSDARNSVVTKLVNYYKNSTWLGADSRDSTALGWTWLGRPTLSGGTVCPDEDADGLPDAYEKRQLDSSTDSLSLRPDSVMPETGYFAVELYLSGRTDAGGGAPPVLDFAPTYRTGADTVWVRWLAATDQPIYTGATDSVPIPTYWDSVPDADGEAVDDSFTTTARMLHLTCDSTVSGSTPLDSADFRDSAVVAGLDPDTLMARKPAGCN